MRNTYCASQTKNIMTSALVDTVKTGDGLWKRRKKKWGESWWNLISSQQGLLVSCTPTRPAPGHLQIEVTFSSLGQTSPLYSTFAQYSWLDNVDCAHEESICKRRVISTEYQSDQCVLKSIWAKATALQPGWCLGVLNQHRHLSSLCRRYEQWLVTTWASI